MNELPPLRFSFTSTLKTKKDACTFYISKLLCVWGGVIVCLLELNVYEVNFGDNVAFCILKSIIVKSII